MYSKLEIKINKLISPMGQKTSLVLKKAKQFGISIHEAAKNSDPKGLIPYVLSSSVSLLNEKCKIYIYLIFSFGNTWTLQDKREPNNNRVLEKSF